MKTHVQSPGILQDRETTDAAAVCSSDPSRAEPKLDCLDSIISRVITESPINFLALDAKGIITVCIGRVGESVGINSQELIGRSIYEVCQDIPEVKDLIPQLISGETGIASLHLRERELDIWHTPLCDDQGKPMGTAAIVINATQRWQVEQKLHEEQALLQRMLRLHERDRQLLAYEIHDGFVQEVTAAIMALTSLLDYEGLPPGETQGKLQEISALLKKAVGEIRRLISGLRPPILEEVGVVSAISSFIDSLPPNKAKIGFTAKVQFERLGPLLEATIYRIVQQAINNVIIHSNADRAEIRLTQQGEWIHIEIEDWGNGFDPSNVSEDRFGLQGIRERARLMRGRAVIDSAPGKGTRVKVDLPVA